MMSRGANPATQTEEDHFGVHLPRLTRSRWSSSSNHRRRSRNVITCLFLLASTAVAVLGATTGDRSDLDPGQYELSALSRPPPNPLLRHQHQRGQDQHDKMCHIWTKNTPKDLCERSLWSRVKMLREISLFSRDCDTEEDNVQLGEFFRLDWPLLRSGRDLAAHSDHLLDGIQGRACLLGSINSDECLRCFHRIGNGLREVDRAYQAFNKVLRRFDCLLAVDSRSATRPFSPNGTCIDCKKWYRKWTLVQLVKIWKSPPCINWCYYAQLACPHLSTYRVVDFAGHPAFLCRDLDIPQSGGDNERRLNRDGVSSCDCVHPCDLGHSTPVYPDSSVLRRSTSAERSYDFFADPEHCRQRTLRCEKERQREALERDPHVEDGEDVQVEHRSSGTQKHRKKRRRKHNEDEDEPSVIVSSSPSAYSPALLSLVLAAFAVQP